MTSYVSQWFRRLPPGLVVPCLLIPLVGLCGLQRADQLYGASRLFEKQMIWLVLSWAAMVVVTLIPYSSYREISPWLYGVCTALLIMVLFMPPINGSRRWIPLGLFDFQPSEPTRLGLIMALAWYLRHRWSQTGVTGLITPFLLTVVPLFLILKEPDLGTATLFLPILFAIVFAAGANLKHLVCVGAAGVLMLPVVWTQMSAEQRSRVVAVFTQTDGESVPTDDGFHLHQSKQVIALGGLTGSVWHKTPITEDSSAYLLPAARTDFIFSLIGERYGVPGCGLLMLLYAMIVYFGLRTAERTDEPFGKLVAVGIVTMVGTQAVINMGMTVGLLPITGITLPLCSYGGSSLLSTSVAMGLLINIAMQPQYEVANGQAWSTPANLR